MAENSCDATGVSPQHLSHQDAGRGSWGGAGFGLTG